MAGSGRQNADSALIAALAGGATPAKAAETAGVSESTVYRRKRDADFCQQVQAARSEMIEQASGRLTYLTLEAIEIAGELMRSAHSETTRLGAVRTVLEYSITVRENHVIEERIAAIEAQLALRAEPRGGRSWAA